MPYKDPEKERAAALERQRRRRERLRQLKELGIATGEAASPSRARTSPRPSAGSRKAPEDAGKTMPQAGPSELFLAGRLVGWVEVLAEYGRPDLIDWEQIRRHLQGRRSVEVMVRHKLLELGLGELLEQAL